MVKEADSTFQEVFSQTSSTDSVKLLPWWVSSAVPLHYMNEVLAITVQQEEDVPVTTTVPKPEGSQGPDPSDSPAHQTGTPPPPVPPLLDISFFGTPMVGHPFAGLIVGPAQKKQDHSLSGTLGDQCNKWTHVNSQEVKVRSKHSSTQGNEDMPELAPEARPSSNPQGQEPTSPPSSPNKATTDPDESSVVGTPRSTGDQDHETSANHSWTSSDLDASRENVPDSEMELASGDCFVCLDTNEVTIRTTLKKYRKRV